MTDRLHILVADDQLYDRRIAIAELGAHDVVEADSLAATRAALEMAHVKGRSFDVILQDLDIGDSRGSDTFRAVKAAAGNTPIVVYTGTATVRLGQELLKEGAADYLVKDPDTTPDKVARALEFAARRAQAARTTTQMLSESARQDAHELERRAATIPPRADNGGNAEVLRALAGERRFQAVLLERLDGIDGRIGELEQRTETNSSAISTGRHEAIVIAESVTTLRGQLAELTPANKRKLAIGSGGAAATIIALVLNNLDAVDWIIRRLSGG